MMVLAVALACGWAASLAGALLDERVKRREIVTLRTMLAERELMMVQAIGLAYERVWNESRAFQNGAIGRMVKREKSN